MPTELSIILVTVLVPGLFLLLFLIIIAVVVIVGLCLCFGRKQGLNCCYKVNTAGERALFLKNKMEAKCEKLNACRPEDAEHGPTIPKKLRKRWRPFCCQETAAEKNAKQTLYHISKLLRPSISDYKNLNNVHNEIEDNKDSDITKDTLSQSSKDQCSSDEEIAIQVTCV